MIVRIVIGSEHVQDVHVHFDEVLIKPLFHVFVLVVSINANNYLHILCVTEKQSKRKSLFFQFNKYVFILPYLV